MEHIKTDILVVGGGVAGLTAAAAFGASGYNVICVDPVPPVTNAATKGADLRTTAFLQPAKSMLQRIGLWQTLSPFAAPLQVMRIADVAGDKVEMQSFDASEISDEPFGWNLPNWLLRREILARIDQLDTVTFCAGVGFERMLSRQDEAMVWLSDGRRISAKLVVAADGRNSAVRSATNIGVKTTRYGQKAVTFAATHQQPHDNISTEIHRSGGPFTLVPLPDHDGAPCSAVVWMTDGTEAKRLSELSQAVFEFEATERSAGIMGPLSLVSPRSVWPIISQLAERISDERVVLIAEAAHVVPPIGAQGLNMSLGDIALLLDLFEVNAASIGDVKMLDAYQRKRMPDLRLRVSGIDALNRASQASSPRLHQLRSAGIKLIGGFKPVRQNLMKLGLGAGRDD